MPYKDPEKQRQYQKKYQTKYWADNKDRLYPATKQRKADQKQRLYEITDKAKSVPCADCGVSYPPYVMDFHHVRGDKEFNIAQHVANAGSEKRLIAEIDKCEVLCSNCHRERTYG